MGAVCAAPPPPPPQIEDPAAGYTPKFVPDDYKPEEPSLPDPISVDLDSPPVDVGAPLDDRDIALVQQTWARAARLGVETVGKVLFAQIFDIEPGALALFPFRDDPPDKLFAVGSRLCVHAVKVVTTVDTAVKLLTDLETLVPVLQGLGLQHEGYGVIPAHYDIVGQATINSLAIALGPKFTPTVKNAWLKVWTIIKNTMIPQKPEEKVQESRSASASKEKAASPRQEDKKKKPAYVVEETKDTVEASAWATFAEEKATALAKVGNTARKFIKDKVFGFLEAQVHMEDGATVQSTFPTFQTKAAEGEEPEKKTINITVSRNGYSFTVVCSTKMKAKASEGKVDGGAKAGAKSKAKSAPKNSKKKKFDEEGARKFLDYAIDQFEEPGNHKELMTAINRIKENNQSDNEFQLRVMDVLPPIIWKMVGSEMSKYGYRKENMMVALLHLNAFAEKDRYLRAKLDEVAKYFEGKV